MRKTPEHRLRGVQTDYKGAAEIFLTVEIFLVLDPRKLEVSNFIFR